MNDREKLIHTAREWLNTPFKHQGRLKGIGCDCVGLLFGIAWEMGWQYANVGTYGKRPHAPTMIRELAARLIRIPTAEAIPGDILFMAFESNPSHLALITDKGIIHAAAALRRVTEHSIDATWAARIRGAYRFKELA